LEGVNGAVLLAYDGKRAKTVENRLKMYRKVRKKYRNGQKMYENGQEFMVGNAYLHCS
jgi:hypothetical protein